jgi:predicted Zn-dependent peptidase
MTPDISVLPNGLRVVTQTLPHLETTSLGVWVGSGSRDETEAQHGLSHLLEHMAFKGTTTRSARDIAEEIEAVGGELNAATGVEMTSYFARVLKGDEHVALTILADILQNSTFADEDLTRERDVILQEIASLDDSPDDLVFDLVNDAAFTNQAAGRPIIGTRESVSALTGADLRGFLAQHYRPANMVVAAAGAVHHQSFTGHVEALFGGLSAASAPLQSVAQYTGGIRSAEKTFEQSHVMLAFEAPSYLDQRYVAGQVLSGLLGGGMSSRLFQEVREKRGLCYSIYSSAWGLRDSGLFTIHAATGKDMMAELISVVQGELQRVADDGALAAEVQRSKAQLKAGLMMSLESSGAIAETMSRQLLVYGQVQSPAVLMQRVDDVSDEMLRELTADMLSGAPSAAVIGAGRKSMSLAKSAASTVARKASTARKDCA